MSRQEGQYPSFDRRFFESDEDFTVIGDGQLGGKALGLAMIKRLIADMCPPDRFPGTVVSIPRLTVLATGVFEQFMQQNDLYEVALSDLPDDRIAHEFLRAELPTTVVGDLRALIANTPVPLAARSSSLLEDALQHPFAGVYATKMIPNNQATVGERFKRLSEAVKYVWASTYFRDAKQYLRSIDHPPDAERMAVVIQEIVGQPFDERFYPVVSGVIRTHNFYPAGGMLPEDGVVSLALGLGKTIVDGGVTWTYCPRVPQRPPPYGSMRELLDNTQTRFWAVNLGPSPYDPINEAEYLVAAGLTEAEWDGVLRYTASTYDAEADRLTLGTGVTGPRVLTFGRILELEDIPLNDIVDVLAAGCKEALGNDVEIEFALTLDCERGVPARFGFLQVRPMMVAEEDISVTDEELRDPAALVVSELVLGNGDDASLTDVVYVKPTDFEAKHTRAVAQELEKLNAALVAADRRYVLIGFGRWGSSDPWLGIPVTWPQLSGARVIIEATLPDMNVDASQGSHFFHNMISFGVRYFTVRHTAPRGVDWDWLARQPATAETRFLRHVRLQQPLRVRVDGRAGRGVILREATAET